MKADRITLSELNSYQKLITSRTSTIYKVNEDLLYKIFFKSKFAKEKEPILKTLSSMKIVSYSAHPKKILEIYNQVKGYEMPFIHGKTLFELSTTESIEPQILQKSADTVANTIEQYHREDLVINDVHWGNIMIGTTFNDPKPNGYLLDLDSGHTKETNPQAARIKFKEFPKGKGQNFDTFKNVDQMNALLAYLSYIYKTDLQNTAGISLQSVNLRLMQLKSPKIVRSYIRSCMQPGVTLPSFNEPLNEIINKYPSGRKM